MILIVDVLTEEDLHRYVDGRLDPWGRKAVEDYFKADPESAWRVNAYLWQIRDMHDSFDEVMQEQVPDRLAMPGILPKDGLAGPH